MNCLFNTLSNLGDYYYYLHTIDEVKTFNLVKQVW
jgi:hypothetical protein